MAEGKAWAERYRGFGGASRAFQRASKHAGDRQGIMRVGVPLVELNRFQCCLGSLSQIGYAIAAPTIGKERSADAAEPKMRFRQLRIELDRLSEQLSGAEGVFAPDLMEMPHTLSHQVPRVEIFRSADCRASLDLEQFRLDCACNALCDLVLNGEDIGEVSVIPLGPDVRSGGCVNQLRRDTDSVRRFPHAAFEHITYPQLAAHLLHVDSATLVGEGRVPSDDEEPTRPRQCRDDVIHDPVREILLLGVAAHVLEWQDCDRWLIRQRQGRLGLGEATIQPQAIDAYRPGNILELLLANILEIYIQSIADLVIRGFRNADSTGLRYPLQPSRHIHTIAEQVLTLDHHITEIDAY